METETIGTNDSGIGEMGDRSWAGEGSKILDGYRDKIRRGVTFSDTEDQKKGYAKRTGMTRHSTGQNWSPRDVGSNRTRTTESWEFTRQRDSRQRSTVSSKERSDVSTRVNNLSRNSNGRPTGSHLPRIIVRDVLGRELDTFTTLQEAIYRAQWNVRSTFESRTSAEWRLPKAPVPSRPDYSRQGPSMPWTTQLRAPHVTKSAPLTSVVEIGVEDVSYIAESLRALPRLQRFHTMYNFIDGGSDKIYFHIVARLLLHQKIFAADDKRVALYEFPGFCTGCRRAGFCYGCRKGGGGFHVHHGRPMRTGGGYAYWRRPDPHGEETGEHTSRVMKIPEGELRLLLDDNQSMSEAARDALKKRLMANYPWLQDLPWEKLTIAKLKEMGLVSSPGDGRDFDGDEADNTFEFYEDRMSQSRTEQFLQSREATRKKYTFKLNLKKKAPPLPLEIEKEKKFLKQQLDSRNSNHSNKYDSNNYNYSNYMEGSDSDDDDKENDDTRKQKLYKEPRFFQVKKNKHKAVVAKDPFSMDRQYNIPKGQPFEIKKSGKSGTKFLDFSRSGSSWKAPRRFELSPTERKTTKFWQPKSGTSRGRQSGTEDESEISALHRKRRGLERSVSPDSGLDSERVTETTSSEKPDTESVDPHSYYTSFLPPIPTSSILLVNSSVDNSALNTDAGDKKSVPKTRQKLLKNDTKRMPELLNKSGNPFDVVNYPTATLYETDSVQESTFETLKETTLHPIGEYVTAKVTDQRSREVHTKIFGTMEEARSRALKIVSLTNSDAESTFSGVETDQEHGGFGHDLLSDSGKEGSASESFRDQLSPDTMVKKRRSPIIKKTRSPIPPRSPRPRSPEPTPPEPQLEEPEEEHLTPEPSRSPTPPPENQYTPDISLPDLPEYRKANKEKKTSKGQKFFVEAPPELKTPPKKRKGPPKVRKLTKMHYRKSKPAEAPVTTEALRDVSDPLDFLAKYCIINPNRLPFYEIIFENMVADQSPRYVRQHTADDIVEQEVTEVKAKKKGRKLEKMPENGYSEHEMKLARDMLLLNHGQNVTGNIGRSAPEEYLEKIVYTLGTLRTKSESLLELQNLLHGRRTAFLAELTRKLFPDVCTHDYVPPDKKKGKKGKKSKAEEPISPRRRYEPVPDDVIVERLTDAQLSVLETDLDIRQLSLEIERSQEKINDVHIRIQQLEGEKLIMDILSSDIFFEDQLENQLPALFRRQQSQLFNKLHPDPDYELNLSEMEAALQQINNHLLTEQEFKYLYFILDLPGRTKINFRLFSVIAALSEKVTQMDPMIRKLLNKFDYNALDVKMEKCKELFSLLEDDKLTMPHGGAPASNLALELTAGGLKPEHVTFVLSKFNREGKGAFDFMDFVTYIPLFIEIHQRIIYDPLCEDQDL